jgi:eukaryotic-like serine/threonine-protein kinase
VTLHGTLGHYRILEAIGEGGMGEVYAAEDTRLHRRVALKVLPQLLAAESERRLRFEREAQAIAKLNHPNIVTIHSVEEADGTLFLTMELVDGKPLSDLIPRNGLPVSTALKIAIGVSDAMAAAQQRGITHRDLKPANVMMTSDGRVKVLDFGVAKLRDLEVAAAAEDLTRAPTHQLTGEGKIIGTIAYMSPEQAEGKAVDPRSDIFSLGVLLHEMVTGDRPFKGDTNVSIISSILKDTPAPVTDINPALPADLARIVRRCLAKDPGRRYQSAADLRNELEDLKQDVESGVSAVVTRPVAPKQRKDIWAAIGALVLVAAAAIAYFLSSARHVTPARTFVIDHLTRLTTTGTVSLAAISADGRYIVHVKGSNTEPSLWVRQTATTSDVQIVPPALVVYDGLAFSPDGNYVYYTTYKGQGGGRGTLYRIAVLGGAPTMVVDDVDSAVAFSPDGRSFVFTRGSVTKGTSAIIVARADGSDARELSTLAAPNRFQLETPAWSPDGKTLLASASRGPAAAAVFAVDAGSGRPSQVPGDWAAIKGVQWLPDGRSFLINAADLSRVIGTMQIWSVSYPAGDRTHVTNDLNSYQGVSVSADGLSLATVQTETTAGIEVSTLPELSAWRHVTGEPGRADGTGGLSWTPDGRRIVYTSATSGPPQVWIVDADGNNARQLTTTLPLAANPFAAVDGRVYFDSMCGEGRCIYRISADGSGLQQITRGGSEVHPIVSPDGSTVYFSKAETEGHAARVSSQGGDITPLSTAVFSPFDISPDGKTLVGPTWSQERQRSVVALLDVNGGEPVQLPDIPFPTANFSRDGRSLLFPDLTARPVRVMMRPLPDGTARPLAGTIAGLAFNGAYSRDGRIAISRGTRQSDAVLIAATPSAKQ